MDFTDKLEWKTMLDCQNNFNITIFELSYYYDTVILDITHTHKFTLALISNRLPRTD